MMRWSNLVLRIGELTSEIKITKINQGHSAVEKHDFQKDDHRENKNCVIHNIDKTIKILRVLAIFKK